MRTNLDIKMETNVLNDKINRNESIIKEYTKLIRKFNDFQEDMHRCIDKGTLYIFTNEEKIGNLRGKKVNNYEFCYDINRKLVNNLALELRKIDKQISKYVNKIEKLELKKRKINGIVGTVSK